MRFYALLLGVLLVGCSRPEPAAPTRMTAGTAVWWWHQGFDLTPDWAKRLKDAGVTTLWVKAGTISNDGTQLVARMPQSWRAGSHGIPVHLVFRFDRGATRHLGDYGTEATVRTLLGAYRESRKVAERKGVRVVGLQLDLDMPTRRLPEYADLLRAIRSKEPSPILSITALPTWLGDPSFRDVARQVDFFVPQFYENRLPQVVADRVSLTDVEGLKRGVEAADRVGRPYFLGVAAYGQALRFESDGRLAGAFRGLTLPEVTRHPSFRKEVATSDPRGEEYVEFLAVKPGQDGRGLGNRVTFRLVSPERLDEQLKAVGKPKGRRLGSAIFRLAEPGERMVVPRESLIAVLSGRPANSRLEVTLRAANDPLALIEGTGELVRAWRIEVVNTGNGPTATGPAAVVVRLSVEGLEEVEAGGFDVVRLMRAGQPSSVLRADTVVLSSTGLLPGEKVVGGPIRLRTAIPPKVRLMWSDSGRNRDFIIEDAVR